ncbi:MAG: ATP-binding cassette domain-containing protein [Verrucomicrobiaceae bacterium]|nr:ATP-binding cassette domain-containing protein [Verrucomicrobiaceae bacterium]
MNPSENTSPFFEIRDLRQTLDGHPVLRGVTFDVPRGRTTAILGGSGAGKSVLLKHLNGLMRPLSGSVKVDGIDIGGLGEEALRPMRRRIGVLFQDGALFDSLTLGENIAFPLREAGEKDEARLRYRVEEVLELVDLKGQRGKMPGVLSGGMRKRAALARAIAGRPDCMLYDEPTAGLDPILAESITRLIAEMKEDLRLTSVVVTHHLGAMRFLADRVIFLHHGEVRYDGPVSGLEASEDRIIREFLSADTMGRA